MDLEESTVRIAVLGDEGAGKSSLIAAAATETFPDHPPPVLPPTRLPADTTPDGVPVVITDTSSRPEDRPSLEAAVLSASVIVLCFAVDDPNSLRRVSTFWMPELRRLGIRVPVVLVGCKGDTRPGVDQALHQSVLPIVRANRSVETCMLTSAKRLEYVGEVFYYALRAVLHPIAPLFDAEADEGGELRPRAARALKRIFLAHDRDGDGVLDDAELNSFQVHCFNAPLQPDELAGVKAVVGDRIDDGVRDGGLTLAGFLFLHKLFVERGRLETTWAVLRAHGYALDLRLDPAVLPRHPYPRQPDAAVELTDAGRDFFLSAFDRADGDGDGVLSAAEEAELFSTAPDSPWDLAAAAGPAPHGAVGISRRGGAAAGAVPAGASHPSAAASDVSASASPAAPGPAPTPYSVPSRPPLPAAPLVELSKKGAVTRAGYLARWTALAAEDPEALLEFAVYLGWPDASTVGRIAAPSRPRRAERRGARDSGRRRTLVRGGVFAPEGVDPAPVLEGLVAQARPSHARPNAPIASAAAAVFEQGSEESATQVTPAPPAGLAAAGRPAGAGAEPAEPASPPPPTVLLRSFTEAQTAVLLATRHAARDLAAFDVAAFLFDPERSETLEAAAATAVEVASAAGDELACVLVAVGASEAARDPDNLKRSAAVAAKIGLGAPLILGASGESAFYRQLLRAARDPEPAVPDTPTLRARRRQAALLRRLALAAAVGATLAGISLVAYKLTRRGGDDAPAAAGSDAGNAGPA